jgi:hypothetical protein
MKTDYKGIYNVLEKNGVIDNLINKYSKVENTMLVKSDIIYGIELAVEFINGSSFNNMKYWRESVKEVKYQIAQDIQKEYARLMIEENKKEIEKFEYLLLTFEK